MRTINAPPRADLVALREKGLSRDEIAAHYKVPLSRVKRWIGFYGIETSTAPMKAHAAARTRAERRRAVDGDGMTLVEKARVVLGQRMGEDFRGYLLDGRPVRLDTLMRAAGLVIPDMPHNA